MKLPACLLAALLAWPCLASACRSMSPENLFKFSETVVVGWISSETIPELDSLEKLNSLDKSDQSKNRSLRISGSNRIFRIVVTETRKGTPISALTIEVGNCRGAYHHAGDHVIAYGHKNGSWQVDAFLEHSQQGGTTEPASVCPVGKGAGAQ